MPKFSRRSRNSDAEEPLVNLERIFDKDDALEKFTNWQENTKDVNQEVIVCRALEEAGFHDVAKTFFQSKFILRKVPAISMMYYNYDYISHKRKLMKRITYLL